MIKLRISAPAMEFIRHERAHLKRVNQRAAEDLSRQIRRLSKTLSEFPGAGAPALAPGDVHRFVSPPYVAEYEIHPHELVILRIYHGRQDRSLLIDKEDADFLDR
jgi:plasmid stabilization system protein ParE